MIWLLFPRATSLLTERYAFIMQPKSPILDYHSPLPRKRSRVWLISFSLLGLLILAYIFLVPHYEVYPKKDVRRDAILKLQNLHTAVRTFYFDTHRYPTTVEGLQALVTQPNDAIGWNGPYLDRLLADGWGNPIHYTFPSPTDPTIFDLHSSGPDGIDGTPDDITKDSK
jgi:general secretion pathway protein G